MRKLDQARDYSGRPMARGDTVSTLNGQLTARVCDIADEGESVFVCLRPLHQPYGKGTWHAADRLIWIASATRRKRSRDKATGGESGESGEGGANSAQSGDKPEKAGGRSHGSSSSGARSSRYRARSS